MADSAFGPSGVKLNFKLRDFFLDLMACIVPGLIFLVTVSIIVGGLFFITSDELVAEFTNILNMKLEKGKTTGLMLILDSYSFTFWLFLLVTFLSYFAGHLLYRQTPKRPDFASFIRIRDRVIKKNVGPWVIEKGHGVITRDVQFPYDNLKNYLEKRGFGYLAKYAKWDIRSGESDGPEQGENGESEEILGRRSKTIINRAKIRLAFFFPEHMMNLIRNEAHIRLASSMWYAAKFTIELSYICLLLILLDLSIGHFFKYGYSSIVCGTSLGLLVVLLLGKRLKYSAVRIMRSFECNNDSKEDTNKFWLIIKFIRTIVKWPRLGIEFILFNVAAFFCWLWGEELNVPIFAFKSNRKQNKENSAEQDKVNGEGQDKKQSYEDAKEIRAKSAAQRIDIRWKIHDHMPLIIFGCLFITHYYKVFDPNQRPFIILYLGVITFILIGVLFAKRYIEQTIHYQRVRELVYVLETAHIANVLEEKDPPETEKSPKD